MVSYISCVYSIAILACFASGVSAIKCYHCYSESEPNCLDLIGDSSNMSVDCNNDFYHFNGTNGCMKVVTDNDQVIRDCYYGLESTVRHGCYLEKTGAKCHLCKNDLCNSSTITSPIVAALTLFFIVARIMS